MNLRKDIIQEKIDKKPSMKRDELIHVNGLAYLEGNLKLAHLRILIAIISHLQAALHFKISRSRKDLHLPEALLPAKGETTARGRTRILSIPVEEFHLGVRNGGRLRTYFEELQETRIVFPESKASATSQFTRIDKFHGFIVGYSFPAYSTKVDVYLLEEMVGRLLLTEEGYSSYSRSSALSLTNKYTVRIYWLICSWRNKGGFVISLSDFRRILCLGPGYDRYDNVAGKIIEPARSELERCFPIWFQYRHYDSNKGKQLVFKICLHISEETRSREMASSYDICFNVLSAVGVSLRTIQDIFSRVDYEDLRPFMSKLMDLATYVRQNKHITNVDGYVLSAMDLWFSDWLERYARIDAE